MYKVGYDIKNTYLTLFNIFGDEINEYIDFDIKLRKLYFK